MDALTRPLGFEQRESARILVFLRWVLLAALLVLVDYPIFDDTRGVAVVGSLAVSVPVVEPVLEPVVAPLRPVVERVETPLAGLPVPELLAPAPAAAAGQERGGSGGPRGTGGRGWGWPGRRGAGRRYARPA